MRGTEDGTSMPRGAWSGERIRAEIESPTPLISDFLSLDEQIQPNGFDLTLASVSRLVGAGRLTGDNAERLMPTLEPLELGGTGPVLLAPGPYQIAFNETVRMPIDAMALGRARSSLNRSGVTIHTAVWDAGYVGRSTALLSVLNPDGFELARNARVLQLVFFDLATPAGAAYSGAYQHEGLASGDQGETT